MSRKERLERQLSVAMREAEDADRVWRCTLELAVDNADERSLVQAARRVHAVWQERERARARVIELQRRLDASSGNTRLVRLRNGASFLGWQLRGGTQHSAIDR